MRVAVKVIAWAYLVIGIAAGFRAAYANLFAGPLNDPGSAVLALLLGFGLLTDHSLARGVSLLLSAVGLLGGIQVLVICIGHVAGWQTASGGLIVDQPVQAFAMVGTALMFVGAQLWVLTRPEVAALFEKARAEAAR